MERRGFMDRPAIGWVALGSVVIVQRVYVANPFHQKPFCLRRGKPAASSFGSSSGVGKGIGKGIGIAGAGAPTEMVAGRGRG